MSDDNLCNAPHVVNGIVYQRIGTHRLDIGPCSWEKGHTGAHTWDFAVPPVAKPVLSPVAPLGEPISQEIGPEPDAPVFRDWAGRTSPGIAFIAAHGGHGCILAFEGEIMYYEFESISSRTLDEHGLDDAPDGLSIWEGSIQGGGKDEYNGDYYDCYFVGKFRPLTEAEYMRLAKGETPWVML